MLIITMKMTKSSHKLEEREQSESTHLFMPDTYLSLTFGLTNFYQSVTWVREFSPGGDVAYIMPPTLDMRKSRLPGIYCSAKVILLGRWEIFDCKFKIVSIYPRFSLTGRVKDSLGKKSHVNAHGISWHPSLCLPPNCYISPPTLPYQHVYRKG